MAQFTKFTSKPSFGGSTGTPTPADRNNTDLVAPSVKLYIEGVQVPFESISISQVYRQRPTADIQIPPSSGLLDIIRGYEPKVHIFYEDLNYGGDRLLFWGRITANSYSRSVQGSSSITFHCEHKNTLLNQLVVSYSGWVSPVNQNLTDDNVEQAIVKPTSMNSADTIIQALAGISGVASSAEVISPDTADVISAPIGKVDPSLAALLPRLEGVPGVAVSLWNRMRRDAYADAVGNLAMSKMYIPLVDESLAFFKRFSGHPFIESRLQSDKLPYCHKKTKEEIDVVTPPCFRTSLMSASQRGLAVTAMMNSMGFSGELTSFEGLLEMLFENIQYDMLTLASPAEVPVDPKKFTDLPSAAGMEKTAVETIVKPRTPFYYSPACNVILPRMYTSLQINQDEASVPTRVTATHDVFNGISGSAAPGVNFRAPHTVREAVAYNTILRGQNNPALNLASTKGPSYSLAGKYEQGVGIRPSRIVLPWWLAMTGGDDTSQGPTNNQEEALKKGTKEYTEAMLLTLDWRNRYGKITMEEDGVVSATGNSTKNNLNPSDPNNPSVLPFERVMFNMLDYEYTKMGAASRSGFISGIFNPYIIPGYPMDVIDESPNHPSFHGFCTSVTHTITANSISTGIGVSSMMTYAELSNYYLPPLPPFLMSALNLVNGDVDEVALASSMYGDLSPFSSPVSTLLQNPNAKAAADSFYQGVLGVGSVAPDDLIHMTSGRSYPLSKQGGILVPATSGGGNAAPIISAHHEARQGDDYYSSVGNLRLISRPIESKVSIEDKFGYKFIDINPVLYNAARVNYVNPHLASDLFLEPGASLFLDYMETQDFIKVKL